MAGVFWRKRGIGRWCCEGPQGMVRAHGLRQGRYFGEEKTDLQAVFTATMVNAERLFTLSAEDAELTDGLREALAA
jgi:hypothetical protein